MNQLHPQNDFSGSCEEWEMRVFLNAAFYSLITYPGTDHGSRLYGGQRNRTFSNFPKALQAAKHRGRATIIAVTKDGRNTCLDSIRWSEYLYNWPYALLAGGKGVSPLPIIKHKDLRK